MKRIDDAVRRILRIKFRAGLFEHPYAPYTPAQAEAQMLRPDAVAAARKAAGRSMVLLKNDGGDLPFDPAKKTAVIGPLARNAHDMLGPWWGAGRDADAVTVFDGIDAQSPGATYAEGCKLSNTEPPTNDPEGCGSDAGFAEAVAVARAADQVVLALGETREMSGEAASRSTLDLPGRQEELLRAIKATGSRSLSCSSTAARSRSRTSSATCRRSSRRGSRASRPATPLPTSCSARSTRAASCRSPSRAGSARCRSTTTTSGRGGRATRIEIQLASPRHPELLPAVRVRLRAQLHDVRRSRTCS